MTCAMKALEVSLCWLALLRTTVGLDLRKALFPENSVHILPRQAVENPGNVVTTVYVMAPVSALE
jgi:hypothetical protein